MSKDWEKGSGYVAEPKVTGIVGKTKMDMVMQKQFKQLIQQNLKQLL